LSELCLFQILTLAVLYVIPLFSRSELKKGVGNRLERGRANYYDCSYTFVVWLPKFMSNRSTWAWHTCTYRQKQGTNDTIWNI